MNMKKGFINLLLTNPAVLFIVLAAVTIAGFMGLGLLNSFTALFGVNIISGALSGLIQPIALVLGAYILFLLITQLAAGAFKKKFAINPLPLAFVFFISVFLIRYAITGKVFLSAAGGATIPEIVSQPDVVLTAVGSFIGGIGVFVLQSILKVK